MNIRNISSALAIMIASVLLVGCEVYPVEPRIDIVYENNSTHNIIVMRTDFASDFWIEELPVSFTLEPNERHVIENVLSPALCNCFGKVIFDNTTIMDYRSIEQKDKNITLMENYRSSPTKDGEQYTYTFTDADYQFALENGTPLEWPTVND